MQKENERDADLRDKVDMQCPAACAQPRGDRGDGDRRQHRDKKGIEPHYRGRASDGLIFIVDMPCSVASTPVGRALVNFHGLDEARPGTGAIEIGPNVCAEAVAEPHD